MVILMPVIGIVMGALPQIEFRSLQMRQGAVDVRRDQGAGAECRLGGNVTPF